MLTDEKSEELVERIREAIGGWSAARWKGASGRRETRDSTFKEGNDDAGV